MASEMLDLSSLEKAVTSLASALEVYARSALPDDSPDKILFRDGVIQRFEFTYELSHKMLKRYLEMTSASPQSIDLMVFQELIRTGSEQGLLLTGWESWKEYRQARTDTSHSYDEEKALRVMTRIPTFLQEALYLLQQLKNRMATA